MALVEDNYRDWRRRVADVLASVARVNTSNGHVLVRSGSLIDRNQFLARHWAGSDEPDDRAAIMEAWRHTRIGVVYLEGVPVASMDSLARGLYEVDGLVGTVDVTTEPRTGLLLHSTLPLRYRIVGSAVRVLHTFEALEGDMDFVNQTRDWLDSLGVFETVTLEDVGVRDTIFDISTNDVDRALRVNEIVALATNVEHAEAVVLWLDVVDFRLTEALHAATRACSTARYSEEAAQGALSCRRFLEQLADVLFAPRPEQRKGHWVRAQDWQNRLWAAIDEALDWTASPTELERLGRVVNEIKEAADKGVHQRRPILPKESVELIERLLAWLFELARLMPPPPVSSLGPYEAGILDTLRQMVDRDRD